MRRLVAAALLVVSTLLLPLAAQVTFAATFPPDHGRLIQQVVDLVNVERQRAGLPPLTANAALTRAAQEYAVVLADGSCFGHGCGSTLSERLDRAGYTERLAWGENIAAGHPTPEAVMAAWMRSSGHRANLLSASYQDLGVGLAVSSGGTLYWVQTFGKSRTVGGTPPVPPTPTPSPTPPVSCSPRPTFTVRSTRSAPDVLEVTVAAGRSGGAANNTLRAVRVGSVANATVDVSGRGRVAPGTTITMAPGTQQATLIVRRVASGAATTVPLILTDACGEWPTFVGGGPSAF